MLRFTIEILKALFSGFAKFQSGVVFLEYYLPLIFIEMLLFKKVVITETFNLSKTFLNY